jgi:general secretion pathway protein F
MPNYQYVAQNEDGKSLKGILRSDNERAARQEIKSKNLLLLNIRETSKGAKGKKIARKDVAIATRQISSLIGSGIPLDKALQSIGKNSNSKIGDLFNDIGTELQQGRQLHLILSDYPESFDQTYISLVAAGEISGNLVEAFKNLSEYLEDEISIKQKIFSALAYPILVIGFSVLVVIALLIFVLPQVTQQFIKSNIELPFLTSLMIFISNNIFIFVGVIFLLIMGSYFYYRKNISGTSRESNIHKLLLKIPFVGRFLLISELEKFSRVMFLMLKSGINLDQSLNHANKLINNVYISTIIKDATDDIIEGKDFLYKIKQAKVFPEIFIQLLSSGFQSGSLLEMFEKLAFYFKDEIDNSRSSLLSIIEPLILIIMGGIITLIILAILLPIMQMNNSFLS